MIDKKAWQIEQTTEPGHYCDNMKCLNPEHTTLPFCPRSCSRAGIAKAITATAPSLDECLPWQAVEKLSAGTILR
jgi:hypothetical protein